MTLQTCAPENFSSCWWGDEWTIKHAQMVSEKPHRRERKFYSSVLFLPDSGSNVVKMWKWTWPEHICLIIVCKSLHHQHFQLQTIKVQCMCEFKSMPNLSIMLFGSSSRLIVKQREKIHSVQIWGGSSNMLAVKLFSCLFYAAFHMMPKLFPSLAYHSYLLPNCDGLSLHSTSPIVSQQDSQPYTFTGGGQW